MANKPGINNLFNIFEGMNAFGAGPGARTRSLLDSNLITQDAIDKANRQSIGTGIVTGLASYLAQPKNKGYGSAVPYLAQSYLQANKAAQAPFQGVADKYLMDTQLTEQQRVLGQRSKTKEVLEQMILKDPDLAYLRNAPDAQILTAINEKTKSNFAATKPDYKADSIKVLTERNIKKGMLPGDASRAALLEVQGLGPKEVKFSNDADRYAKLYSGKTNEETGELYPPNTTYADLSPKDASKALGDVEAAKLEIEVASKIEMFQTPEAKVNFALKLGGRYDTQLKESKYLEMKQNFEKMAESVRQESPIGDVAAATQIMKLLDPGSVVRESELKVAMKSNGLLGRLIAFIPNTFTGKILTAPQRKEFLGLAKEFYLVSEKYKQDLDGRYSKLGDKHNLDIDLILGGGLIPTYNPATGDFD
mgnify:CR=1 FL=1